MKVKEEGVVCVKPTDLKYTRLSYVNNNLRSTNSEEKESLSLIKCGVYHDIDALQRVIIILDDVKDYLIFELQCGGYIQVICICTKDGCANFIHWFSLSEKLHKILGFKNTKLLLCDDKKENCIIDNRLENLINRNYINIGHRCHQSGGGIGIRVITKIIDDVVNENQPFREALSQHVRES
ncbi:hypothetical protein TSAR_001713 [Trichomalopsis sarcophagae]|uniref:Uncharacterized protein n=1 Tax=Trichomalopsis sarcophagae TaxID=543379 RepID=A0A232F7V1_9HYME|nr:hypothetical protein TSAR_001713 [Trichomalopsis sarcophagae]